MLGLWAIGRLAEGFYGPVRTFAIYVGAGVLGAVASHLGGVGRAVGRGVGRDLRRPRRAPGRARDRRQALLAARPARAARLARFVAAVQVAIGFMYTAIDQWAHVAGLAGGIVLGLALSRTARPPGPGGFVARTIAVAGASILVASAVLVATTELQPTPWPATAGRRAPWARSRSWPRARGRPRRRARRSRDLYVALSGGADRRRRPGRPLRRLAGQRARSGPSSAASPTRSPRPTRSCRRRPAGRPPS